jgi:flavin reductase (DIM6/NTAB) family NADH-FMN oxidoreductase RutF
MGVDAATFRAALGQWPSGVTVVTTVLADEWHGMTASSFSSVSLDPPLVSFSVARSAASHDRIAASGVFAVNILAKDQVELGKRFAGMVPGVTHRFEGLAATTAKTGCPLLPDVLAWLDCEVRHEYAGGDHTIFVGEVLAAEAPRMAPPLLYHSRVWGQFADVLPQEVVLVDAEDDATPVPISATPAESALAGDGPVVLVDDGTATPLQVRGSCAQVLLLARPRPVSVRLDRDNAFAQANLLTALKSGISRIEVGPQALDEDGVRHLLAALDITTGDGA